MAIDIAGLFARLGHIFSAQDANDAYLASTIAAKLATVAGDYGSSLQSTYGTYDPYPALAKLQSSGSSFSRSLRTLAQQVAIATVKADVPQADGTIGTAIAELLAQMASGSQTVNATAIGLTATAGTNRGDGVFLVSDRIADGKTCDNLYAETLAATVTADSFTGNATAGSERLTVAGAASVDAMSCSWPGGSGASVSLSAVDASLDAQGGYGNLLTNGDFETWTAANTPGTWGIGAGVAGTQILQSSSPYDGTYAISFVGDGTTQTEIYQAVSLLPRTSYGVNLWLKADAGTTGVLEVALVDGSNAITSDDSGNANSLAIDLSTLGTAYSAKNVMTRTPRNLPTSLKLRLRLATAANSGHSLTFDRVALARGVILYPLGPSACAFSGATPFAAGDSFALAATNTRAGKFLAAFERNFGMASLGLSLPTSGTPTIADYS